MHNHCHVSTSLKKLRSKKFTAFTQQNSLHVSGSVICTRSNDCYRSTARTSAGRFFFSFLVDCYLLKPFISLLLRLEVFQKTLTPSQFSKWLTRSSPVMTLTVWKTFMMQKIVTLTQLLPISPPCPAALSFIPQISKPRLTTQPPLNLSIFPILLLHSSLDRHLLPSRSLILLHSRPHSLLPLRRLHCPRIPQSILLSTLQSFLSLTLAVEIHLGPCQTATFPTIAMLTQPFHQEGSFIDSVML